MVPKSPGHLKVGSALSVPKSAESGTGILKQTTKKFKEDFFEDNNGLPVNLTPGKSKSKQIPIN